MKYIKVFGLVAAAATALVAFAGVGPASATVLCKATETPCSESNLVHTSAEIDADVEPPSLFETTSGVIIESCAGGTLKATVTNQGGATATVTGAITSSNITWTGCEAGGLNATQSGELEIHYIEGTDNGTLTGKGFGLKLAITGSECIYSPSSKVELGVVTGGATNPKIDIHTVLFESNGNFTCLESLVWIASYRITNPNPLYVRAL